MKTPHACDREGFAWPTTDKRPEMWSHWSKVFEKGEKGLLSKLPEGTHWLIGKLAPLIFFTKMKTLSGSLKVFFVSTRFLKTIEDSFTKLKNNFPLQSVSGILRAWCGNVLAFFYF